MIEGDATIAPSNPLEPVPITTAPPPRGKRAVFARRLASAIALWAVLLGTLVSGNALCYFGLIGFSGMAGLWEFYGMLDHKPVPNFKIFGMICAGIFFGLSFYFLSSRNGSAHSNNFEMAVLLIFLLGVFGRQLFTRAREKIPPLETMAYTVFGLLYVPWLFNFITKIIFVVPRDAHGAATGQYYVLYLIAVAKFSDMGAYLTGSVIGRHKMVPHISPSKTWEGFAGALGFSLLASYGLRALMPVKLGLIGVWSAAILGIGLSVAAVIGDLAESILKRSTGVKDSGSMLPGIGGVLDLIDSLLFTAPLLYFYLVILVRPV
jgi:phosphatidate cytidylyltransferase